MSDDRPDPLAPPEGYGQPRPQERGEPVTHAEQCVAGGCRSRPRCCLYLGDASEHIGHLCLCATHYYQHTQRIDITCRLCGKPMKIIKHEPKPGNPYHFEGDDPPGVQAIQRVLDQMGFNDR